ncbi:ATP-binding protein [Spirosoma telluris]|uniref:hybrid sensor histidine kinase/response regulator transcription factor n=1 Tax=Spirosoma telluris TaxID=2183553 RepID=UPI002FC285C8
MIVQVLASSFVSLADSRSIRFSFEQNCATYWARFDQDKLEKITTNLLSNAFKFTPDGNEIRMQVSYPTLGDSGTMTLTIKDTGIGIASENLPHIFDRFYQVDANVNRSYEGTGVGLALVNELVNVLHGTISVQSKEGVGTTMVVSLPIARMAEPLSEKPEKQGTKSILINWDKLSSNAGDEQVFPEEFSGRSPESALEKSGLIVDAPTLLIIDDNTDIRTYVRSIFEVDYQIVEAEDGQLGLERATQLIPDLVICDLMMPRLDGFGFCRRLKTQESTSHIPVIMLTAKATIQDRIEGFELGADEYLTKPFNLDEIRVRVRNLLDKQDRLRQYFSKQPVTFPIIEQAIHATTTLSREAIFLQKARQVIDAHYTDSQFGVDQFSAAMHLSPSQLLRKLKALAGITAVEFLRQYRLERAATLLSGRAGTVSEIAYHVGFESLSYFTRTFQEQYGVLPSEYGPD